MQDLLYVVLIVVLVGIGVLFVLACDKIVGPDELELVEESDTALAAENRGEKVAA